MTCSSAQRWLLCQKDLALMCVGGSNPISSSEVSARSCWRLDAHSRGKFRTLEGNFADFSLIDYFKNWIRLVWLLQFNICNRTTLGAIFCSHLSHTGRTQQPRASRALVLFTLILVTLLLCPVSYSQKSAFLIPAPIGWTSHTQAWLIPWCSSRSLLELRKKYCQLSSNYACCIHFDTPTVIHT